MTVNALKRPIMGFLCLTLFSLALVGCGGGMGPCGDQPCTTRTPCHPKFAKRAFNKPYQIRGTWYAPQAHYELSEHGTASYYGGTDVFHGRPTSTGERFDMNKISAAHKTLPLPSVVRVTNLDNGRSIKVKVNDRGPFIHGRIIDLSRKAAQLLGFYRQGTARVHVETLVEDSLQLARTGAFDGQLITPDPIVNVGLGPQSKPLKRYSIRVAEFAQVEPAKVLLKKIQKRFKNNQTRLEKVRKGSKVIYRLMAGPFDHPAQAEAFRVYLKRIGCRGAVVLKS